MSIYEVYDAIEQRHMFLPALQRRFVWGKEQIELLFDSIMRGYPFGTFLFWKLTKETAAKYVFYEFKKSYDERNPFNEIKDSAFVTDITGVLDGQQRLSSIYIGLQGTHTEKRPRKRKSSQDAYQETRLYLNLLSLPYKLNEFDSIEQDESRYFEFRFLSEEAAAKSVQSKVDDDDRLSEPVYEAVYWFPVKDVMYWAQKGPDIDGYIKKCIDLSGDSAQAKAMQDNSRFIKYGLDMLHKKIYDESGINYFGVDNTDLEDILKIFVRVNSGGTVLSKADLLFSTIVASWDDGRKKIEELMKTINGIGLNFGFGTEYLMRCCLVLSDGPVSYKVLSFRSENVQAIRDQWSEIAKAIIRTVELLSEYGFSKETLSSNNATIPIAYYIYKGGLLNPETKKSLRLFLIRALLKRIFSAHQDQILSHFRSLLREEKDGKYVLCDKYKQFDFSKFVEEKAPIGKSLKVTGDDIDSFLEYQKGGSAFAVLSLLYPNLQYETTAIHQDHMHPASGFNNDRFTELKLSKEDQEQWLALRDQIPNLQLLEASENKSKNDTPLKDWVQKMSDGKKTFFIAGSYLPEQPDFDFAKFRDFFDARREKMKTELGEILSVTKTSEQSVAEDEIDRVSDEEIEGSVFDR